MRAPSTSGLRGPARPIRQQLGPLLLLFGERVEVGEKFVVVLVLGHGATRCFSMCSFISVLPCPGCSQERQRGSTNSSSSHAPLIPTITSAPNSTKGLTPSARTISKPASASPASRIALAIRKERKRRMIATRTATTRPWARTSDVTPQADAPIIRVWKDERVVGVVSLGWRFLQAPCRGTVCTFDLARLPGFYTCQDDAHVSHFFHLHVISGRGLTTEHRSQTV
jgi:hypothetical protein